MARTRLTLTNDASVPRVIRLSTGVVWYAYLRGTGLYVQREVGGVLDPEVLVTQPVTWVDGVLDPSGTSGWLLFLHDGHLAKIQVTNLAVDPFLLVNYTRSDHWRDSVPALRGPGTTVTWDLVDHIPIKVFRQESIPSLRGPGTSGIWNGSDGPDPPSIFIEGEYGAVVRTIGVDLPNRTLYRNRRITEVRLYRQENHPDGFSLHAVLPVGLLDTRLYTTVPITGTPETLWMARCARLGYQAGESLDSNVVADPRDVVIYHQDLVTRGAGAGVAGAWGTVSYEVVKKQPAADAVTRGAGAGTTMRWVLNGQEIINP